MRRKLILWMLLLGLLVACGTAPAKGVDHAAATQIVATFMAQMTQTAASAPATLAPPETESPEETESPLGTPTPDAGMQLLGRFRTVTVIKGNLFVRDGMGLPRQITKSGTDHDPVISADGQKIVFYRGEGNDEVFVVNADGSDEKVLLNSKLLPALRAAKVEIFTFRAKTHELLFTTTTCSGSTCLVSRFFINASTATITPVVSDLSGSSEVSPDGQYVAVVNAGQMELRALDGKVINTEIPGNVLPVHYWLPDSSSLIAIVGTDTLPVAYTIWRYHLKDDRAEQVGLTPTISAVTCIFSISPDRSWILYQNTQEQSHLGNLKLSETQPYPWDSPCDVKWSPNSQHFASQTAIGSVDGTPPITIDGHFIAWLDATHYLFSKGTSILDLQTYVAEVGNEPNAVPTNFIWSPVYAVMP